MAYYCCSWSSGKFGLCLQNTVGCFDHSMSAVLFLEWYGSMAPGPVLSGKHCSGGHHVNLSASGDSFSQFGKYIAFNG